MDSVLDRVVHDLRSVEKELRDRPVLAQRVRAIAALLAGEEVQWIGTTKARRLLGVRSENTVKAGRASACCAAGASQKGGARSAWRTCSPGE